MTTDDQPADQSSVIKETVPLWLAVAITVVLVMPLALWLGEYNFALWCSFIVWSEYFFLGAKPECLKLIVPTFSLGVVLTALTLWAIPLFDFLPSIRTDGDLAATVALFLGVAFMVYIMSWSEMLQAGSLPYFNGISMTLAIYFTGSFPAFGETLPAPLVAGIWTILMGAFGSLMGVFNVWLTFPRAKAVTAQSLS